MQHITLISTHLSMNFWQLFFSNVMKVIIKVIKIMIKSSSKLNLFSSENCEWIVRNSVTLLVRWLFVRQCRRFSTIFYDLKLKDRTSKSDCIFSNCNIPKPKGGTLTGTRPWELARHFHLPLKNVRKLRFAGTGQGEERCRTTMIPRGKRISARATRSFPVIRTAPV